MMLTVLPSWGVSIFVKVDLLARDSSEGRLQQVVQQLASVDRVHGIAESRLRGAQLFMHVMEAVSHGIDGVDDKAHFTVLNIVFLQTLISWWGERETMWCRHEEFIVKQCPTWQPAHLHIRKTQHYVPEINRKHMWTWTIAWESSRTPCCITLSHVKALWHRQRVRECVFFCSSWM